MLLIRRIEIENFVCFDEVTIEPSVNSTRPLTVIRAENGSGKTTLLRAIRWGMYGEQALPGNASHFSLHPADWRPDAHGVRTRVVILFETDGSTRDHPDGNPTNTAYELRRTVTTVANPESRPGEPDFRRIDEEPQLMVQQSDGSWDMHEAGVDTVVDQLLPWDLRDFFVMDADEAADFVGGSENKLIQRKDVIDKTSFALGALLGLDVFDDATQRVRSIAQEFGRSAAKAVGSADLERDQARLDALRSETAEIDERLEEARRRKSDISDDLEQARSRLEALVGSIGGHEETKQRLKENRARRDKAASDRTEALRRLSSQVAGIDLLASLAARELAKVRGALQPLYDDGSIPLRHVPFVQSLLKSGICVCGQDLSSAGEHKRHVQELVDQSRGNEGRANYLAEVLNAAKQLEQFKGGRAWQQRTSEYGDVVAGLDEEIRDLDTVQREIDMKLANIDAEEVQVTRDKIDMLEAQKQTTERDLSSDEDSRDRRRREINELDGRIRAQTRRQREARDDEACQEASLALVRILEQAYENIRDEQVGELDAEMNRLFARMAANVVDDEAAEGEGHKAPLRMIDRVGLKSLDGETGQFEIFALNSRGRSMPPTEINGASRRILALSFVLALCKVSRTRAPLVADSLLNFMSGSVRTNTLRVTAETASQPILLLTGSDLESLRDVDLVSQNAGAKYTLTGQWQHTNHGGDVVNLTDERRVSLICDCGPREFCTVCERVGQSGSSGWRQRVLKGGVN